MLFDQVRELPVATVRRDGASNVDVFLGDLWRWFSARWRWLRPRTIPVTVAFLGMLGVLQAVSYLSTTPPPPAATAAASGAIFVDGKPYLNGTRLPDLETSGYRVRLIVQQ